ncbi:MAG: heat-inducible transcriptional repressor HrcA, partial [Cucumibacter sp.]
MPALPGNQDFLSVLNARSQEIFRRLVERYLETGQPVGSRQLSRLLDLSLSPASVRNVMADLEDLGLIAPPHTSAGRAPTQQGLRFFIDAMLEISDMDEAERRQIA